MTLVRRLALAALLALGACAAPLVAMNRPIGTNAEGQPDFAANYGLAPYVDRIARGEHTSDDAAGSDVLLFVTISGGGKRAAAFGHGALRGLGEIPLSPPDGRRLSMLNVLDYIAGVSGGSFPAAHYGLYRDRSFETFPQEFLRVDINAFIWGIYLLPWNSAWLSDPQTGTNDYMARVYDRLMFHGATFADLERHGRPIVSINATDITNGATFSMLGTNFGLLCSDINSFSIARAVAASNGFPGLFSAVSLRSYAERCNGARPPLAAVATVAPHEGESDIVRRRELARLQDTYADPDRTHWVHLMDGGIADNLALRSLLNLFIVLRGEQALFRQTALKIRRVLVLSIDGQAAPPRTLALQRSTGGVLSAISAASGTQIDVYNFETLALARQQVNHLADGVRAIRCETAPVIDGRPCEDVRGELVHISLADVQDAAWRDRLGAIPTGLTLEDEDVDALVRFGTELVRDNPTIRAVARDAGFPRPGPAVLSSAPRRTTRR